MKKTLFLSLLFSSILSFGTIDFKVSISVKNNKGRSFSNARVVLIETKTKKAQVGTTGSNGKVKFTLTSGEKWSVNVEDMKRVKFIKIPDFGKGSSSLMVTYDMKNWTRLNRPAVDRSKMTFTTINQEDFEKGERPKKGNSYVIINLKKLDKSPLKKFPITLTCYKSNTKYIRKTNKKGLATFEIPNSSDYEIDIEGNESISYIDLGPKSGLHRKRFTYQPLQISEKNVNDTIIQSIPNNKGELASTGRSFLRLQVSNFNPKMKGSTVYLKMLKGNKVYKAKIRKEGEVLFMLPLHRQYMIETNIHKAIDIVDLMDTPIKTISRSMQEFSMETGASISNRLSILPTTSNDYMVKSFDRFIKKQYPSPETGKDIGLYVKWATPGVNSKSKEALLEVGFNTKNLKNLLKENAKLMKHKPINLSFVIDISGSMAEEDRLTGVKTALKNLLKDLSPNDIVSIITFSSSANIVVPAKTMSKQTLIYDIIDDLQAGGATNIYSGLMKGYQELGKRKINKGTNRLILLSDGYGSTPVKKVIKFSKKHNLRGLECSAIGIGSGFNMSLMSSLASVGGGLMHYVGSEDEMGNTFKKELFSIINPMATNATIEIKYKDQLIYKQLYGYESNSSTGKTVANINNLYPGLNKLFLVKFDLLNPTKSVEKSPVIVTLSYTKISGGKEIVILKKEALKWEEATGKTEYTIEANYKKVLCIATLNQGMKVMADLHANGNSKAAQKEMVKTKNRISEIYQDAPDSDIQELLRIVENYITTFDFLFKLRQ